MAVSGPNPALLKLQQNMQKTTSKTNTQALVNLPIKSLDWNPDNEFIFGMKGLEQFAEILKGKFKGAVVVFDKGNVDGVHRYEIGSGHRRVEAKKLAGDTTIPCIVLPMPSDVEKAEFLIDSNIQNRPLTAINYARAFSYLKEKYEEENEKLKAEKKKPENVLEKIAKRYGMTKMSVNRYISLNRLIPELQQMIEDNVVAWTSLSEVSKWEGAKQQQLYQLLNRYLQDNAAAYEADDEAKITKITTPTIKALIAELETSQSGEKNNGTEKEKVKKRVDYGVYLTKLSSQISKIAELSVEDVEIPEDTSEIKDAIKEIRNALDRLDEKIKS